MPRGDYGLIDPFLTIPPPPDRPRQVEPSLARLFHASKTYFSGATLEEMVRDMDEWGIEVAVLDARSAGNMIPSEPYAVGQGVPDDDFDRNCADIVAAQKQYPGRFQGCIPIDPSGVMRAVRQLERAVRDDGFRSCWIMPSLIGLPINHAVYYPVYAKCVELGVSAKVNVGVPGPMRFARPQLPMALDEVLLAFPELKIVAAHVGHPWHVEMIALLQKYPNLYLITSGWAPRHVPPEIWKYMNGRGAGKVLWSSDYPLLSMERCVTEGWEVPLNDAAKRRYLRENANEVYGFGL